MIPDDPILNVLLWAGGAALFSAVGVLPGRRGERLPTVLLGWSNALAAGLMLGVAYSLLGPSLDEGVWAAGAGALLGIGAARLSRSVSDTEALDLNRLDDLDPAYGHQVVLVSALHAAWEGVAIGAAMLLSVPFGISMAAALALHNVPEAILLSTVLSHRGVGVGQTLALAVGVKLNQVLLAVVTFAVVGALPGFLPWAAGFAAGALLYLVLDELLPESYRQAGHTSIALVTLLAMGMVVGLAGGGP